MENNFTRGRLGRRNFDLLRKSNPVRPVLLFFQSHSILSNFIVAFIYVVFCAIQLIQLPLHSLVNESIAIFVLAIMSVAVFLRRKFPLGSLSLAIASPLVLLLVNYLIFDDFALSESKLPFIAATSVLEPTALAILLYTVATLESPKASFYSTITVSTVAFVAGLATNDVSYKNLSPLVINIMIFFIASFVGSTIQFHKVKASQFEFLNRQMQLERKQHEQLAISAERARLAREMHDIVAHSLAIVITMADGAKAVIDKDPQMSKEAIAQISQTARSALVETRRVVGVLREDPPIAQQLDEVVTAPQPASSKPSLTENWLGKVKTNVATKLKPAADEQIPDVENQFSDYAEDKHGLNVPLVPQPDSQTIESLINEFKNAGLPIEFVQAGMQIDDDPALGLTVFRILQEALTNILRYAPLTPKVDIELRRFHGGLTLKVFNVSAPSDNTIKGSGKGLIGMRERAAVYDGTVEAGAVKDGWKVKVFLRLDDEVEEAVSWSKPM